MRFRSPADGLQKARVRVREARLVSKWISTTAACLDNTPMLSQTQRPSTRKGERMKKGS